jgi:hypothetical protein
MTSTSTTAECGDPAELQLAAERFKAWRSARSRGERIPKELWEAAIELARIHGSNPTAAALTLNYKDLERRVSGGREHRKGRPGRPAFVELPQTATSPDRDEVGTVELLEPSGSRLILRFPGVSPSDLMPVVELLLGRRR